jgi:hypothetical protein
MHCANQNVLYTSEVQIANSLLVLLIMIRAGIRKTYCEAGGRKKGFRSEENRESLLVTSKVIKSLYGKNF